MSLRTTWIALAAAGVASLLVTRDAAADCAAGSFTCGTSYCTPAGDVCCASAGHPELYCPAGDVCTTSGACMVGGACASGSFSCGGSYCTPTGDECCASVGHPELYCLPGQTCTTGGTCAVASSGDAGSTTDAGGNRDAGSSTDAGTTSGEGGTCAAGTTACGPTYCTQPGFVCCLDVGHPELSCPEGTTCTANGACETGPVTDAGAKDSGASGLPSGTAGAGKSGHSSGCDMAPATGGSLAGALGLGLLALGVARRRTTS